MAKENNTSTGAFNGQEHRVKGSEIFVGGLARTVTVNEIREIFSSCGEIVELRMMKDQSGASKGFCFVRFATKEAALKAHKEKNGIMVQGKKVGVAPSSDKDQLFFGNLRKDWSSEEFDKLVHQAFEDVVAIDLAMLPILEAPATGKKKLNRGFAFVQFSSHAAAARAYRIGSRTDFVLPGGWHPLIDWAEKEPELDSEELAKVKVAFIGNLPTNTDEDFLRKLFEPLGKIERVALSRKGPVPVGFVHFANRSELENAINEMDGKTVQGPYNGPTFKIQVAIAKSGEKDKKRVRDETIKPGRSDSLSSGLTHDLLGQKSKDLKSTRFADSVVDATDPYEEAVITLPSAIKERLLRIFRLGIASRYDVEVQCIVSLKELPESAAIAVLDQFMLSGAEKRDKGAYLTSLLSRHQVEKLGSSRNSLHIARTGTDYVTKESELISLQRPLHTQAIDRAASRYSSYRGSTELHSYCPSLLEDPLRTRSTLGRWEDHSSYRDPVSRSSLGRVEPVSRSGLGRLENSVSAYRDPVSRSSLWRLDDPISSYWDQVSRSNTGRLEDPASSYQEPVFRLSLGRLEDPVSSYRDPVASSLGYVSGIRPTSRFSPSERASLERPQIKFDPFTGQPYKFDPFTGEPIRPEAHPRH